MGNIEDLVELPLDHGRGGGHCDGGDDAGVEVVVERHHQGLGACVQVQLPQKVVTGCPISLGPLRFCYFLGF